MTCIFWILWASVQSGFSREIELIGYTHTHTHTHTHEDLLWDTDSHDSGHWEVPQSCHLQAGDPGKPVVQLEDLRTRLLIIWTPIWVWRLENHECGEQKIDIPAQIGWVNLTGFHIFIPFRLSMDWVMLIHIGEDHQLYLVHQFKCWSLWRQPHRYTQNPWLISWLGILWPSQFWHTKLTITAR